MTNKKLILGALTILIILVVGFAAWKMSVDKPDSPRPETHSYFICPDGSQHGPGIPGEVVQEWCEKNGFVIMEENTTTSNDDNEKEKTEAVIIVSGYVISGGDTTPEGLFDTPRRFIYKVQKDDGTSVNVQYTAYPPSPVGDRERKKTRLDFHGGTIKIGDYLKARGTYEKENNVLIVSNEGDYIETYSEKQ